MKKSLILVLIFSLSIIAISLYANQTNENSKTSDSSEMVNVLASIEIKEGHLDAFKKIFVANVPNVLAEKGCIEYLPTIDVQTNIGVQKTNKNIVTIIEKWESLEHLYAHLKAPHMNTYREKVKDMVVGVSIKVLTEVPK